MPDILRRQIGIFEPRYLGCYRNRMFPMIELLPERQPQVVRKTGGAPAADMACGKASTAGSVSQRACVFCGSRVVLYPIADALHIVHGPIGCAA